MFCAADCKNGRRRSSSQLQAPLQLAALAAEAQDGALRIQQPRRQRAAAAGGAAAAGAAAAGQ